MNELPAPDDEVTTPDGDGVVIDADADDGDVGWGPCARYAYAWVAVRFPDGHEESYDPAEVHHLDSAGLNGGTG